MADSIALKDVTTKLTATEAKLAEVTLTMRDHEVTIGTLKAENARLKDESTKLAATLIDERVAEAFDTYKDAKKLDEGAKDMMRVYCMTNRDGFDKLYPRVPSSQRVLLRSIVTPGGTGARDLPITTDAGAHPTTAATVVEGVTLGDTPNDTAVQLKTKDPTMSMSDAIQKALRLHAKARG